MYIYLYGAKKKKEWIFHAYKQTYNNNIEVVSRVQQQCTRTHTMWQLSPKEFYCTEGWFQVHFHAFTRYILPERTLDILLGKQTTREVLDEFPAIYNDAILSLSNTS